MELDYLPSSGAHVHEFNAVLVRPDSTVLVPAKKFN
jgi:hypothetical protein